MPSKLYISGPMTGLPGLNKPAFQEATQRLRALGYPVYSPAEFGLGPDVPWSVCMRRAVRQLMECDGVATLPDWQESRGASIEHSLATALGMEILSVSQWALRGLYDTGRLG